MIENERITKTDLGEVSIQFQALYNEKADSLKSNSLLAEEKFDKINFKKIFGKNNDEFNLAFEELNGCLKEMIFFFPKKTEIKLKERGFTKEVRQWFIPLNEINKEIERINSIEGMYINPYKAVLLIEQHLIAKLLDSILIFLKKKTNRIKSGYEYNLGHAGIFKFFTKLNKSKKDGKKITYKPGEARFHLLYIGIKQQYNMTDKEAQKYILDLSRGKTEKTLLYMLFNSISKVDDYSISENQFYINVYDLFSLIEKNYFNTEEEFDSSPTIIESKSYRLHKIKQLKDLIH